MWLFNSPPSISAADAAGKVLGANVAFIDVRTPEEFATGHAKGAVNYPLSDLNESVMSKLKSFAEVYVICQSGARSSSAVSKLIVSNIQAFSVTGGTSAWRSLGLPLE